MVKYDEAEGGEKDGRPGPQLSTVLYGIIE